MKTSWHRDHAVDIGKAKTRDGRRVYELKEAVLDGRPVLVGCIDVDERKPARGQIRKIERRYWEAGGLGMHGGDDLMDWTL